MRSTLAPGLTNGQQRPAERPPRPEGPARAGLRHARRSCRSARSCAELLIVDQLIRAGWGAVGVRVSALGNCLGLVPDARLSDPGRCGRARRCCGGLRAAAGRQWRLRGVAGVFAWLEPGQVRLRRGQGRADRMRETRRRFLPRRCVSTSPPASASGHLRSAWLRTGVAVAAAAPAGPRAALRPGSLIMPNTCADSGASRSQGTSCAYGAGSVKPSAQPTLVRTQHLPPPGKTAPDLR
jgi:hypothetical protein